MMGWLNAIGNIILALVVGFIISFGISAMMTLGAAFAPVSYQDTVMASYMMMTFAFMFIFGVSALVIWGRKRLLREDPPEPGHGMSKYAKATCIIFGLIIIMPFFSLGYNLANPPF